MILEKARDLLSPFPKVVVYESEEYKISTFKKVKGCYYKIQNKKNKKQKRIYKNHEMLKFEKDLKKFNIDKTILIDNVRDKIKIAINSIQEGSSNVDFYAMKRALHTPDEIILLGKSKKYPRRILILNNKNNKNEYQMVYFYDTKTTNKKGINVVINIPYGDIVRECKRENIDFNQVLNNMKREMDKKYSSLFLD